MNKSLILTIILTFSLFSPFFAQESSAMGDALPFFGETESDSPEGSPEISFFSQIDKSLFFTLGPKIMLNTDDETESAPSPVMYSLGVGGDFAFKNSLLAEVQLSFFTNYYLWDGENARPAEVENRTATALSFMLDLDCLYTFRLGKEKNHLLSVGGGIGFLARYAVLSNGVDSDDVNRETGSRAGDDVSDINGSFYKNLNFLYPEAVISYSYILSEIWKVGGEFKTYFPLGPMTKGRGLDGMIFSLAVKLSYK
ncbi:MAG: hypothetical protein IJ630_08135 [Treponema sp.]|nr:hypothetical protein [Treponema sp.]